MIRFMHLLFRSTDLISSLERKNDVHVRATEETPLNDVLCINDMERTIRVHVFRMLYWLLREAAERADVASVSRRVRNGSNKEGRSSSLWLVVGQPDCLSQYVFTVATESDSGFAIAMTSHLRNQTCEQNCYI